MAIGRLAHLELKKSDATRADTYPFSIPAVRHLSRLDLSAAVTFFVGENGSGKSTVLEALAVHEGFNPEGGSRNFSFATRASHSALHEHLLVSHGALKPLRRDGFFYRAESFYNVASEIERLDEEGGGPRIIDSYGGVPLHEKSHGQALLALLENRFAGGGLFLMDEPESALSPTRQLTMLVLMHRLTRAGSQFVIATHSPILLAFPGATIYLFKEDGVSRVPYTETEHWAVTRAFLNQPDKMQKELLDQA